MIFNIFGKIVRENLCTVGKDQTETSDPLMCFTLPRVAPSYY